MNHKKDFLKKHLGVPDNWDHFDYQTQRYSFEDIEEALTAYDETHRYSVEQITEGLTTYQERLSAIKNPPQWGSLERHNGIDYVTMQDGTVWQSSDQINWVDGGGKKLLGKP